MSEQSRGYRIVSDARCTQPMFTPAAWRVLDAARRLKQIEDLVDESARSWQAHLHARAPIATETGDVTLTFPGIQDELAELGREATTLASEVIHHCRTALDYCAHHIAWLDSGERNESTQFPLEETPGRWSATLNGRWLNGVNSEHREWIHEVQPYRDITWSRNLKRLSNQDKHRVAVEVHPAYTIAIDMQSRTKDPLGDPSFHGFNTTERMIDLLLTSAFTDDEDQRALPTLWDIVTGVAQIVNRFLLLEGNNPIEISPSKPTH